MQLLVDCIILFSRKYCVFLKNTIQKCDQPRYTTVNILTNKYFPLGWLLVCYVSLSTLCIVVYG
jgi:hypothetical protein